MELATMLIWTLRIVLPIILFCIYFKLQSPKEESWPGPTKNKVSRGALLNRKNVTANDPVPDEISTVKLAGPDTAPDLFAAPAQQRGGGRDRAGRDRGKGRGRGDDEDKPPRERRDRQEKRSGKTDLRGVQPSDSRAPDTDDIPTASDATTDAAAAFAAPAATSDAATPEPSPIEEKKNLESLLNYVAFNRKEQQRTFIVDETAPPPPPPPPPKKPAAAESAGADGVDSANAAVSRDLAPAAEGEDANADAQKILNGAIKLKRGADVAHNLYNKLSEQEVEISERTFALMIEACVQAQDLKSSSDFLMKMEAAGHAPDTELLDEVMELYSSQKTQRESARMANEQVTREPNSSKDMLSKQMDEALASACAGRAKLSSTASLFVPFGAGAGTDMQPPPPPGPPPSKTKKEEKANEEPSLTAEEAYALEQQRTSLKASAKAFQPQGAVTFDPYTYTWTVANDWERPGWEQPENESGGKKGNGGKGKGKGTKSKGDAKDKDKDPDKKKGNKTSGEKIPEKKNEKAKKVDEPKKETASKKSGGATKWQVKS